MLLQVVNLVLQASAEQLERDRLPGLGLKLEIIDVLDDFEPAGDDARQRNARGLRRRIVGAAFEHDRIIDDDKLADAGDTQRGGEAKLAQAKRGVWRGGYLELEWPNESL